MVWSKPLRARKDPKTCQHPNTYKLGSSTEMVRFKCKDCGESCRQIEKKTEPVTQEEKYFSASLKNYRSMTAKQVVKALAAMKSEVDKSAATGDDSYNITDGNRRLRGVL